MLLDQKKETKLFQGHINRQKIILNVTTVGQVVERSDLRNIMVLDKIIKADQTVDVEC